MEFQISLFHLSLILIVILTVEVLIFESVRRFEVWDYNPTHGRLLLRSPGFGDGVMNIDILFVDVIYLQSPTNFIGLQVYVSENKKSIYQTVEKHLGQFDDKKFIIKSNNENYIVVAAIVKIFENNFLFNEGIKDNEKGNAKLIKEYSGYK